MAGTTDYAILGILTHGSQSGYDIKKKISGTIGYFWQESYGQLYPALKDMERLGLLTVEVKRNKGKPDKKIYHITTQGRNTLKGWLEKPVESIPKIRHELLLKLFFGNETVPETNIMHVSEYKNKCKSYLKELKRIKLLIKANPQKKAASKYWLITLSSGLHSVKAEIAWCEETLNILTKEK